LQVPDPVESFESVLPAARRGEEWAIASLYRALHPRLLRYLRAQEPGDAEDLASEVWLDSRHLSRFEGGEADLRAWAFTVARHRVLDLRRARRRRRTEPVPVERLVGYRAAGDVEGDALDALGTEAAVARIARRPPPPRPRRRSSQGSVRPWPRSRRRSDPIRSRPSAVP